ncbi:ABC transporter substrate-binding protein [Mycobacterium sp. 852002-10029_SCH5224772]|uniref:ABC transporter substrate-binding protein n=1 Tax=Mycobacterium sp. 852002-10029_SCH5224772 TaxID=1834083 RepID=UPI001E3A8831|nr:ABC transporter substrate-binding protein [Mycobacterium sp. 852002-10029_SCH5224772]
MAYVADQEGYYADEGVHVAMHDGTGWDIERLRRGATIGLGRSMLSRLTDGIPWTAVSVNTHQPLFWFLGGGDMTSMQDLRGRRLAIHAAHTAPGCFGRTVLRRNGIDPDRDIVSVVRPPDDYGMDLRWLREGAIDAAMVGSTMAPEQVAAEYGLHVLGWIGECFQVPTVGIAVDPTYIPLDSPALAAVVRANRRALHTITHQPEIAVAHMHHGFLGRHTVDEVHRHYDHFIAPYFSDDGHAELDIGQDAITAVAKELGVPATVTAAEIYRTDLESVSRA